MSVSRFIVRLQGTCLHPGLYLKIQPEGINDIADILNYNNFATRVRTELSIFGVILIKCLKAAWKKRAQYQWLQKRADYQAVRTLLAVLSRSEEPGGSSRRQYMGAPFNHQLLSTLASPYSPSSRILQTKKQQGLGFFKEGKDCIKRCALNIRRKSLLGGPSAPYSWVSVLSNDNLKDAVANQNNSKVSANA